MKTDVELCPDCGDKDLAYSNAWHPEVWLYYDGRLNPKGRVLHEKWYCEKCGFMYHKGHISCSVIRGKVNAT